MTTKSGLRHTVLLCLLLACSATLLGDPVNLVYAPPEGSAFDVVEKVTRISHTGEADAVTDVRERKYRVNVLPTETGFANTATVQAVTLTRNDHQVASPVFASMQNLQLTYELGADGSLVGISGYEGLPEAMRGRLPASLADTMTRLLNLDSLRHQDEMAYREVYRDLPGSTRELGVAHAAVRDQVLPLGGSVPLYIVETLEQETTEDGMEGPLVLTRMLRSDALELAAASEDISEEDLAALASELTPSIPESHESVSVHGTDVTVFDPAGLLVAERTEMLTYVIVLKNPDQEMAVENPDPDAMPIQHRVSETREFMVKAVVVEEETTE